MSGRSAVRFAVLLVCAVWLAGCASKSPPPHRSQPVALIIAEAWEQKIELPREGFWEGVNRSGRDAGRELGQGFFVTGCAVGAVGGAILAPPGWDLGCAVVGYFGLGVGYVVGYGVGAVAGTAEGALAAAGDKASPVDVAPLRAAFQETDPDSVLEKALDKAAQAGTGTDYTRLTGDLESSAGKGLQDQGAEMVDEAAKMLAERGYPYVLVLRIDRFDLTTSGVVDPTSRLNVSVSGEMRETAKNRRVRRWSWGFESAPVEAQRMADDDAKRLRKEMDRGWQDVASRIIGDVWGVPSPQPTVKSPPPPES